MQIPMTRRVQKTLAFVKERFSSCRYFQKHPAEGAYRLEHSIRVAHIAAQIAEAEGFDVEHAAIAGLLHDVGYGTDFPDGYDWNDHGRDGARIARPFLEGLDLPGDTVDEICYGIAIHVDDRADFDHPRTPFAETVGDADNIDRFDAYRVYDHLRWANFADLSLAEKLDWLRERLLRLERLEKMDLATPTATALWRDKIAFQTKFFGRLLAQMERSALPDGTERSL